MGSPTATNSTVHLNACPRRPNSTVIIFDWDDTICPSTFVDQCQIQSFRDFPLHFQNLMNEIGRVAAECLEAAAQYGEVIIITNSDDGWVKYSAERYVPNLLPILPKYRIVSARTAYEQYYPGQPLCWKAAAFAHEVNEFYCHLENEIKSSMNSTSTRSNSNSYNNNGASDRDMDGITSGMTMGRFENQPPPPDSMVSTDDSSDDSEMMNFHSSHRHRSPRTKRKSPGNSNNSNNNNSTPKIRREVISFGDSMEERTAVKIVSCQLAALSKSVMFLSSPSPEQLIGQLVMLTGHMKYVCEQKNTLDLEISPDQAEKMAKSILNKEMISGNGGNNYDTIGNSHYHHHHGHHPTNQHPRDPMEKKSFHEENVHNHRPSSNAIPRMRRAGSSENGGASGPVYDETFSL